MIDVSKTRAVELQFATESGLSSWAIRWFTHSDYSHVDMVLPGGKLLGARLDGGVKVRDPGYGAFTATKRVSILTPKAPAVYRAALQQRMTPYDWKAIIAFAVPALMPHRNWRDPNAFFCSELVAWALEQGGFFTPRNVALPANKITPGDLLLLVEPFAAPAAPERPFS